MCSIDMDNNQIEALRRKELQILLEIDRICKKRKISYQLAFGTLIGAVRHQGFIPWDDDIDVAMERIRTRAGLSASCTRLRKT